MKAGIICESLMKSIETNEIYEGKIHSVFNSACNILTEKKLITILTKERIMAPMSIIINNDNDKEFNNIKLLKNQSFYFKTTGIYSGSGNKIIEFTSSQLWSPVLRCNKGTLDLEHIEKNINIFELELYEKGKLKGIAPLMDTLAKEVPLLGIRLLNTEYSKECNFIKTRFLKFINCCIKSDIEEVGNRAEQILGFGIGLTPSMDDFICGLMVTFIYLGKALGLSSLYIEEFNRRIITKALEKTTRISAEMLMLSAKAMTNEAVQEFIYTILYKNCSEDIKKTLKNIINFGETSGSDTAFGIYVGFKILTNKEYRRFWENASLY